LSVFFDKQDCIDVMKKHVDFTDTQIEKFKDIFSGIDRIHRIDVMTVLKEFIYGTPKS
jgi:Ca2+-binding EF-hand superfamily protein